MYIYHWQGAASGRFDCGLVRPDGSLRPSYAALLRGPAGQAAAAPAIVASTLRWSAAWSKVTPHVLLVRVRCLTSGGRCTGRVALALRSRRVAGATTSVARLMTRAYGTSSSRRAQTLRVAIGAKLRARLRVARTRRLRLRVVPSTPSGAPRTLTIALARPG